MSTHEETTTSTPRREQRSRGTRDIPAWLLWFATLGGVAAWGIHLMVAWSVMELSCISPADGPWVDQRGGSPGVVAWSLVVAGTAGPWLVAVAAFLACLAVRRRHRRLGAESRLDVLSGDRVAFLMVLGLFLDLMSVAAITGGIIALFVLEPC